MVKKKDSNNTSVTLDMIQTASDKLKNIIRNTPIIPCTVNSSNLFIKAECLQVTGSFKIRGAYNKLSSLTPEKASRGVIACSAGNHAQGVALSASKLNIRSVICMPFGAPILKIEATKRYGAKVVLVNGNYDDSAKKAEELAKMHDYTFAHPFNDPYVIAGQGTIGLELIEQMPDVKQVLVPVGGGGLVSGIAIAIKSLRPDIKVIGVQSLRAPSMYTSMGHGHIMSVKDNSTIADGIHVLTPGNLTFNLIEKYVDDIVTVSEDEIAAAIVSLMESSKIISEGAGAAGAAAFLFNKVDTALKTVAIVSGGNIDTPTLEQVITKGLQKNGRISQISVQLQNDTKSMINFLTTVAECGINVINISYERTNIKAEVNSYFVTFTFEALGHEHIEHLKNILAKKGYELF